MDLLFEVNPIVSLLGPRQCGKTTLARDYASGKQMHYFDLENPIDLQRLEQPMVQLSELTGLIVIDEIQRRPDLFPMLRVLVDEHKPRQFLILGSASRDLLHQSSETLTGRISYCELTPFSFAETQELNNLWLRGGFPRSYLANNDANSFQWRMDYIRTFVEQDIRMLGIDIAPLQLGRFWQMLAHTHGNIFNASELGRSLGFAHTTAKRYLDILTNTFMIRTLTPWHENISKRQVKSPKIYFRDSGIFLAQLQIASNETLMAHPKLGAAWEGFALEEVIRHHHAEPSEVFFWATQGEAELDLLICKNGQRLGFEFKFSDAPRLTKSMHIAMHDLQLDVLTVLFPGKESYVLADNIRVIGLVNYL
ncbi:MAG: hypothetical protein A3H51_02255 [Candidatus Spechtbacteria bacterium RIFCSPLOWO2_02_FULL_38_8]|uniref:AAA+ ATPase domain-containing protein n=1 Tax=Candidatus Spechtbacteria bacterium RIFCSPLOWO2_02_FULL_38_8 TaxID=1802164 RepID=A0A1G2HGF3_9BACT|nr:MAG: hypothetical protein A3H51_02255 [Candidatus Spechtbacteria bacterium RIFCSPLOWO2_02_FULL_38_8]